jgi:succinyl-CoA synthetase beta subunit
MWAIPASRQTIRDDLLRTATGRVLTSPRWTVRGSLDALVDTLMKLQNLALWADARIRAVDVNPLVVGEAGVVAVDALIVPATAEQEPDAHEAVA